MNFIVDMPLGRAVATWLSSQGHDVVHARDLGLDRAPDVEIVVLARRENRIVVTHDLDFPRIVALSGQTKPAIIVFRDPKLTPQGVCEKLAALLKSVAPSALETSIVTISPGAVRVRPLPV